MLTSLIPCEPEGDKSCSEIAKIHSSSFRVILINNLPEIQSESQGDLLLRTASGTEVLHSDKKDVWQKRTFLPSACADCQRTRSWHLTVFECASGRTGSPKGSDSKSEAYGLMRRAIYKSWSIRTKGYWIIR